MIQRHMGELEIRELDRDRDGDAVLGLLSSSLGWVPDELHRSFFEWKHEQNPFGRSRAWVAVDRDTVAGFRTFLRWRFTRAGESLAAVRAVDTATDPRYRGQGLFTLLTRHALEELASEGVAFVFNTPNDQSLPGYLKMGWRTVGRLPAQARPRSLLAATRTLRARAPADLWSEPSAAGEPALDVLCDDDAVTRLLSRRDDADGVRTDATAEFLRWRYGFAPLQYRAIRATDDPGDGFAIFRVRRRGEAREAALCDVLTPDGDRQVAAQLMRRVARESGADHTVALHTGARPRAGYVPLPRQGPVLVHRSVRDQTSLPLDSWSLTLGDIELF